MGKRGHSFGVDVEIVYPMIPELPFPPPPPHPFPSMSKIIWHWAEQNQLNVSLFEVNELKTVKMSKKRLPSYL